MTEQTNNRASRASYRGQPHLADFDYVLQSTHFFQLQFRSVFLREAIRPLQTHLHIYLIQLPGPQSLETRPYEPIPNLHAFLR